MSRLRLAILKKRSNFARTSSGWKSRASDAFFKLGEHQFLAMFENKGMRRGQGSWHFGIMVRDEARLADVRDKLTKKYGLKLIPGFRVTSAIRGGTASRSSTFTMNR